MANQNQFLNNYGSGNAFLASQAKPNQSMQPPNMSTPQGPKYSPPPQGTMSQLMAMGAKSKQPGGTNSGASNTLPAGQTAPVSQQNATDYTKGGTTPGGATYDSTGHLVSINGQPPAPIGGGATSPAVPTPPIPPPTATPPVPATSAPALLSKVASYGQQDPGLTDLYGKQQAMTADYTNKVGNIQNTPSDLNYQTGRLASIQNEYNTGEAALANTYQANLAQRTQGIGASENALSAATTLTQSPYGTPLINPATGQTISGGQDITTPTGTGSQGAIQPNDPAYSALQQYAQMAANGQVSAIPSAWTSNPVINAQINQMAKTINPNYNPIASAAQGATEASNIQTGGTAATGAAASGLAGATKTYNDANTAYKTATQQSQNLQQTMISTGVNNNPQFINSKINSLQNQFGSVNYTSFITALNEAKQSYTNLLSSVGASTPTVNGQQATDIFNENSTPQQINAAIDALNAAAYTKVKPLYDQMTTYSKQLNSNPTNSNANTKPAGYY